MLEIVAARWLDCLVDFSHRFDLVPLRVQGPPNEHHDSGRRRTRAVVEDVADLGHRNLLSPIRELHDRPDLEPFSGLTLDLQKSSQPGGLPRDPGRIVGMAESRVVGHDRQDVEVLRLGFQIDSQLGDDRALIIGIGPRTVKRSQQRAGPFLIEGRAKFPDPVREDTTSPSYPDRLLNAQQVVERARPSILKGGRRWSRVSNWDKQRSQKQVSGRLGRACSQLAWAW